MLFRSAQLQSQAQQPIEDLKTAFWLVKEKQGKVLAQFFKLYYADKEFSYKENVQKIDEQGNLILNEFGVPQEDEMQMKDTFNSSEFADTDFSIVVETMSGTKASTAGDINALDVLMSKGLISLKTYISAYPKDALSNKTDILKGIEEDEKNQVAQLTKQAQAMAEQLKESMEVIQRQKDTVDKVVSVIQENNQLKSFIAQLYTEAKSKILEGNQEIEKGNAKIREVTDDATNFAQVIAQGGMKDVVS